ncbi:MAG TPA: glycosyltransferase [Gemmatimonadales bacterium]|jgi:cellulose synthase/poly-beta-1,6-N-acetylglucosamine synthase-like glycosyltransferase|nr:glycosyltransferase [Gemmatimonadales bacterium]
MLPRVLLALTTGFCLYTYLGYPVILTLLRALRRSARLRRVEQAREEWPRISIVLPVYNEADVIAGTLERLLAVEYPADRRQILVVSDASTDATDAAVSRFRSHGVELLQLPQRQGKTAAENAARRHLTGAIIINTDASVRVHPEAIQRLVAAFRDPAVGVASGRDVSVANLEAQPNAGEEAYVGYEMWVRDAETTVAGIVGASGCLYAIRAALHMGPVPPALSRDFAAALTAREHGLRAVSVPEAICFVPRGASLRQEYRRKVRTITRGLGTLGWKRALLNPWRYGAFAWMLFSHKVCRWLVPWALLLLLGALGVVALTAGWARAALTLCGVVGALAGIGWLWREGTRMPRLFALPAYVVAGNVAVLHAWLRVLAGARAPVWEPTRRGAVPAR